MSGIEEFFHTSCCEVRGHDFMAVCFEQPVDS